MTEVAAHHEHHFVQRAGWLRAAVLGANDGIVSTASLLLGVVSASHLGRSALLVTGLAALVAGAMSMAAGEYISVSSQRDIEQADVRVEREALLTDAGTELEELSGIYRSRGLDPDLALRVAEQLMAHDALEAHLRDELGIHAANAARPLQAAASSAVAFAAGAALPVGIVTLAPTPVRWPVTVAATLLSLCMLGVAGARASGARWQRAVGRVVLWSSLAMALTSLVGALVGRAV